MRRIIKHDCLLFCNVGRFMRNEVCVGSTYPNGRKKSYLYETFLSSRDFGMSNSDYAENLSFVRIAESKEEEICEWTIDIDGECIVCNVLLASKFKRIVITNEGFKFKDVFSKRLIDINSQTVTDSSQLQRLFFPRNAIKSAYYFIGRKNIFERIFEIDLMSGCIFFIRGERAIGKTSLCYMLNDTFSNNSKIQDYYLIDNPVLKSDSFISLYIDISEGVVSLNSLFEKILLICGRMPKKSHFSGEANLIVGKIKYTPTSKTNESIELVFLEFLEELTSKGKRLVLILDEFESFLDTKELAPKARAWVSNFNVVLFFVGTGEGVNNLIDGHKSIARNAVSINLNALTILEFEELYYIASKRAYKYFEFSNGLVKLIHHLCDGRPYFGQLLGELVVQSSYKRAGSKKQFLEEFGNNNRFVIDESVLIESLGLLPEYCSTLEDQAIRLIEKNSLSDNELVLRAKITKPYRTEIESSQFIEDPTLRRYILLTRDVEELLSSFDN